MSNQTIEEILSEHRRKKHSPQASLLLSLLSILATIPSTLLRGCVVHLYWGWFITLAFGVNSPGILICTGLYLMWNLMKEISFKNHDELKSFDSSNAEDNFKVTLVNVALSVLYSISAIFFGFILHFLASRA